MLGDTNRIGSVREVLPAGGATIADSHQESVAFSRGHILLQVPPSAVSDLQAGSPLVLRGDGTDTCYMLHALQVGKMARDILKAKGAEALLCDRSSLGILSCFLLI